MDGSKVYWFKRTFKCTISENGSSAYSNLEDGFTFSIFSIKFEMGMTSLKQVYSG